MSTVKDDTPSARVVLLLAAVAGFVDAAGYLLLGNLFVAHITGNISHLGQRIGIGDAHAALPAFAMVGMFVASIALTTAVMDRVPRRPRTAALSAEVALLVALALTAGSFWLRLALAVCAMGVQTAAVTKRGTRTVRTTYLSGMGTRLGQSLVRGDRSGAALYGALLVCFAGGATGGAFAFSRWGIAVFGIAAAAVAVALGADVLGVGNRKNRVPMQRAGVTMFSPQPRVMLQPIAAPSVLGNFALGSALIMYGSWFAGGWGTEKDVSAFFPFLLFFGGFGQLAAALWAYRARGAASAALHGSWAAFWLGLGLIFLLVTTHTVTVAPRGAEWQSLGQWMIYMAVISWTTAFAALARNPAGFLAQGTLGTGAALAAAGLLVPSAGLQHAAGWVFVAAGTLAFYAGAATMLDAVYGKAALPFAAPLASAPLQYSHGDPGVKVGQ